jgi:hypothetical protein
MRMPSSIIVPCPMCEIPLVIPMSYTYPDRRTIDIEIDKKFIREHAEACPQRDKGGDGDG